MGQKLINLSSLISCDQIIFPNISYRAYIERKQFKIIK